MPIRKLPADPIEGGSRPAVAAVGRGELSPCKLSPHLISREMTVLAIQTSIGDEQAT